MKVFLFKVWLATPFCTFAPWLLEQNECHCTEIIGVTQEPQISKSPGISWEAGAADRHLANPGHREGEVTACKSSLSMSKEHFNYLALAGL